MSRRRRAKAAASAGVRIAGLSAPPELRNRDAEVWHDRDLYVAFMRERGWPLPPSERFGVATHPANRRAAAAAAWAVRNGVTNAGGGHADRHRLRELGLID